MNDSLHHNSGTALVLGGGGSGGHAWLIGVIAGLFQAGLDVTRADLLVGTSAGATAAAQIASAAPTELIAQILAAPLPSGTRSAVYSRGAVSTTRATNHTHMKRLSALIAASGDVADMRRKMGAAALETSAASDPTAQWRVTVATRLPSQLWPEQRMLITAVDADNGDPAVFDRDSGVNLVDAVAASCAGGGFAYRIGARRYIDGGYRSNAENADLAAGYGRVLVLSPFGGRSLHPVEWGTHLATQLDELRACGSRVETIFPDSNSRDIFAFGGNVMDPSTRLPAAQAGYNQGRDLAKRLTEFWHGRVPSPKDNYMTEHRNSTRSSSPDPLVGHLGRAFGAVGALIQKVQPDQWSAPTPCPDWTVRQLVDHLIGMNRVFTALLADEPMPRKPAADHVESDPLGTYRDTAAALQAEFASPGVLDRAYWGPLGSATGADRLQIRLYDLLAHGWDLAQATNQPADLPDDVAEHSLAFARTQLRAETRPGRFAPTQAIDEGTPAIERLAAFLGRRASPAR